MKTEECEKELEKLIGGKNVSLWYNDTMDIFEIAYDSKELNEWFNGLDEKVFVKEINEDVNKYELFHYGVDRDYDIDKTSGLIIDSEYTCFVLIDGNNDVVVYGYSSC